MGLITGAVLTVMVGVGGLFGPASMSYSASYFPTMENCVEQVKNEADAALKNDYFKVTVPAETDERNYTRRFEHSSFLNKNIIIMSCRPQG